MLRLESPVPGPIAMLPTELLTAIFRLCIPRYTGMRDYAITSKEHAPLLLCLVCSAWRRLAIATPFLWKELCLDLVYKTLARDVQLMELFIARSQDQPLSLQFGEAYTTPGRLPHPMTLLASVTSRIHALELPQGIRSLDELEPLAARLLPCLEVLRFGVEALKVDNEFWWSEVSGHAPALVSFTYDAKYCEAKMINVGFQWSQLRHLSVTEHFTDFPGLFQALQECSTLVSCHLNLEISPDADDELWHSKLPDVTLPRVKRLMLQSEDQIAFVLQHIRAPLLEDLCLESNADWVESGLYGGQPTFGPLDIITSFISHHAAHLRQLTLRWLEIPGEDLRRCLEGAEHLKVLRLDKPVIRYTNWFMEMFWALTWPYPPVEPLEPLMLPNLQHLFVALNGGMYLCSDLTELIGSRFSPGKGNGVSQVAGLKSVTIIDPPDDRQVQINEQETDSGEGWADNLRALEALEAGGLQVIYEDLDYYDWGFIDWAWVVVDDRVR